MPPVIGSLRPADGPVGLIAVVSIAGARPHYDIELATVPPTSGNARWTLVSAGNYYGIQSLNETPSKLAMTVSGAAAPGATIVASEWKGAPEQLWKATNPVGRIWNFYSYTGGLMLQTLGGVFGEGVKLALNRDEQDWVFPDDS